MTSRSTDNKSPSANTETLEKAGSTLPPIDMLSAKFSEDPASLYCPYHTSKTPVHFDEQYQAWLITDYAKAQEVLASADVTNDRRIWEGYNHTEMSETLPNHLWVRDNVAFYSHDPKHIRNRKLINRSFSPSAIKRIEGQVKEVVNQCCQPILTGGIVDFATEVSPWIPYEVVTKVMGVRHDAKQQFRESALALAMAVNPFNTSEQRQQYEKEIGFLLQEVRSMLEERSVSPQDDLISDFLITSKDDENIHTDDIVSIICALIATGSSATKHAIDLCVKSLLENQTQLSLLLEDRTLIDNAVNELLRVRSPVKFLYRYARKDTSLGGYEIKKGQQIMISADGFNNDANIFEEPETLDITRANISKAITFGHGPHFCIGAHLARTEIKSVIEFILDHSAQANLIADGIEWDAGNPLSHSVTHLPINTSSRTTDK